MSEPRRRLTLTPAHLVRVDAGLEALEVHARGYGLLFSSLGFFRVWRSLDALRFRRVRGGRARALFLGLHGVAWVSISLPPGARTSAPVVKAVRSPELPSLQALPSLRVQLTVTSPAPPEGLP